MRFSPILALPLSLVASFAAAEATPEGAAALTATLQTYLGATEGVVTVTPEGEAYAVSLDFAPLIAKAPAEVKSSVTPIAFSLTDNGDGTWEMEQDQALDLTVTVPGQADISVKIGNLSGTGTFDEALSAFSTSTTRLTDIVVTEKITDPQGMATDVTYTVASASFEGTSEAGETGVDSQSTYAAEGISESFQMPGMDGAPMQLKMTAQGTTGDATITGLRPDALYKLVAFFVANPDQAAIAAQQASLKTILTDGLPLFENLVSTSALTAIAVDSPMGAFGLADMAVTVEANGVVEDGLFREAFTLNGLSLPAGLVPDWAAQLVPTSVSLDFAASRFNLAAPAAMLLQTLDLANPQPNTPEQDQALLAALLPDGVVDITLAPGSITAPIYGLTYQASFSAGPATPMPQGKATVTATGMTAVKQALTAAPEDIGMQVAPMLGMAEGMAKPGENGALVWELETTPEGGLLVNGVDMMQMGGN